MHGTCRTPSLPLMQRSAPPAVRARDPRERLSDLDRQEAADLLGAAFRDGVLRMEEFDERLTTALAAEVAGDLAAITGDLPAQWLAERQAAEAATRRAAKHRRRWSAEVRLYAGVMAMLLGIWAVVAVTGEGLHDPWPLWPALGWGIPLFLSRPRGSAARAVRLDSARGY